MLHEWGAGRSPAYADCVKEMAALPFGTLGQTTGNTFSCRAYHVDAAMKVDADADVDDDVVSSRHCSHASKEGGGQCMEAGIRAKWNFCNTYTKECDSAGKYSDCMKQVTGMPQGKEGDTQGNSFQCRAYHLKAAMTKRTRKDAHVSAANINLHCPHASPSGANVCRDKTKAEIAAHAYCTYQAFPPNFPISYFLTTFPFL